MGPRILNGPIRIGNEPVASRRDMRDHDAMGCAEGCQEAGGQRDEAEGDGAIHRAIP
jgi:hypothetical protein